MDGGINAWNGMVAEGIPDSGRAYFSPASNTKELIALSWIMEDGSRRFYSKIAESLNNEDSSKLFKDLTTAEEHHKSSLLKLFKDISGEEAGPEFPSDVFPDASHKDIMEGGINVTEALTWARGKSSVDILELAIALEINAYDLYIIMAREMTDENFRKAFTVLADEEKQHLERLSSMLEKNV